MSNKRIRLTRSKKVRLTRMEKQYNCGPRVVNGIRGKAQIIAYLTGIHDSRIFGLCFYRSYKKLF